MTTPILINLNIEPQQESCEGCSHYRIHNDDHMCILEAFEQCQKKGDKRTKECLAAETAAQSSGMVSVLRILEILGELGNESNRVSPKEYWYQCALHDVRLALANYQPRKD